MRWELVVGAGVAWSALIAIMFSGGVKARAAKVTGWKVLEGPRVRLERGKRYRGCVRLPWYAPTSLVRSRLEPGLLDGGFRDVVISERRAADWPDVACHFFVEATWDRDAKEVERPEAVALAWEADA